MLKSSLKYLGEKAAASEKPCRVMLEPLGIRINMWQRTDDNIFADRNHMIGWTELDYLDNKLVDMIFHSLEYYIEQRVRSIRKQREMSQSNMTEQQLGQMMKAMHDYERKTRGD